MVFGELVIPSSRSLWEDDFVEFVEQADSSIEWHGDHLPETIDTLVIVDTNAIISFVKKCITEQMKPIQQTLDTSVRLYDLGTKTYLLIYENNSVHTTGEIIGSIQDIIRKSKNLYGITSLPFAMYQGVDNSANGSCTIYALNSSSVSTPYPKLNIPNIVTGICAALLTYAIHKQQSCAVFISFLEAAPLDSINTQPLLDLFKYFGIATGKPYELRMEAPSNNLYM